ncbi:MAG: HI0074 family nucleotidyltransferase substrate-binding subunit [Burkholderiales bacterium]
MLDFTSLTKAIASLSAALEASKVRLRDEFVRDASIQRFKYTYELCVKSLRRQLEAMSDTPSEVDALGYRDMIRSGIERGLLSAETPWFAYRELRNITAHVYDPAKAARVFDALPALLRDAEVLLANLRATSK